MSNELEPEADSDQRSVYQVRLQGHLGRGWADWFGGGATLTLEAGGQTLLTCAVADQAALHGVLRQVRDLGLPLVSITRVEPGPEDGSEIQPRVAPSCLEGEEQDERD